ncbi:MAG: biotin/lipoyl-containing protein, partial [Bacteroidota bacterium]
MAEVIRMPKMSDTMEEGVITSWLKKEGEEVSSGDVLAEVETDKATMELESYQDGVLLYIGVKEKESVPVDGILAIIGEEGEDYQELLKDANDSNDAAPTDAANTETSVGESEAAVDTSNINATVIRMPKMSDTMEEGVIASWIKKVGDEVESGDILAEVETDKATMELEAYEDGTLLYTAVEAGNGVPVDGIIAIIGEKEANFQALLDAEQAGGNKKEEVESGANTVDPSASVETAVESTSSSSLTEGLSENGRVKASPLARKIASDKGIKLSEVKGSGPEGRIIKKDVENFTPTSVAEPVHKEAPAEQSKTIQLPKIVGEESSERIELSQMRKAIARRLSDSKFSAPHFYLTMLRSGVGQGKGQPAGFLASRGTSVRSCVPMRSNRHG